MTRNDFDVYSTFLPQSALTGQFGVREARRWESAFMHYLISPCVITPFLVSFTYYGASFLEA
jgi:hypothetical protein